MDYADFNEKSLPQHNQDIRDEDPLNAAHQDAALSRDSPANTAKPRNTDFLTGLRGLAAFLVFFYHHLSWFYDPRDDLLFGYGAGPNGLRSLFQLPFFRVFFTGGNAAVAIFFVLSGYVLSISPLRKLRDGQLQKTYTSLLSSTIRRPFRLFIPPVGFSLIFALWMQAPFGLAPKLGYPQPEANIFAELSRWVWEITRLINPFVGHGQQDHWFVYNPPAYTIATEFKGSIIVFALLALYSRVPPSIRMALFVVTGLISMGTYQWSTACFMWGVTLAMNDQEHYDHHLLPRHISDLGKQVLYHASFFSGWFLLCQPAGIRELQVSANTFGFGFLTHLIPTQYAENEYWRWWQSWGALLLVYGVLRISWLQRFFSTKALLYLGRVSFSLYLIHMPMIWTLSDKVYRTFGRQVQPDITSRLDNLFVIPDFGIHGLTTRFLVSLAFIVPLNIAIAHVGTVYLDEPSVTVGRKIVTKLGIEGKR
ncbi:hypothetical protein DOTSEDRAFT_91380 [Dothistroma septosporum NZE10]|uniref:Acyltransferase 3 domain-containing protein n=1 Tax=Dothistroma septosporum (strain NZE10 / CBS 128990) TaxID=675120 RepID=N1PES9_DOTSN|nr:hypothetical protein DOTSEDRAFT_91380 [Dothistroma septosporum NZE10]